MPTCLHKIVQNTFKQREITIFLPTQSLHKAYMMPTCYIHNTYKQPTCHLYTFSPLSDNIKVDTPQILSLMAAINSRENLTPTSLPDNLQYVPKQKILSRIFLLLLSPEPAKPYLSSRYLPMQMLRNGHFDIILAIFMQVLCRHHVGFMQAIIIIILQKYRQLYCFYVGMQALLQILNENFSD